jgi:hypothetical protein
VDHHTLGNPLDPFGGGVEDDPDAGFFGRRHQRLDDVRVEDRQRVVVAVQDRRRGAEARRHVRQLEGDVAAAHEQQRTGEVLQVEEVLARQQELGTREPEGRGTGAGRDAEVRRGEPLAVDLDGLLIDEPR